MRKTAWVVAAGAVALVGVLASRAATPIRVMILDGESGGPYHKWQLTTQVMRKVLDETGLFDVQVVTAPAAGASFAAFKPDFGKFSMICHSRGKQNASPRMNSGTLIR